jgi:hypothetical protein
MKTALAASRFVAPFKAPKRGSAAGVTDGCDLDLERAALELRDKPPAVL